MPIKGLTEKRQMPRLGKIRLGVMIQPAGDRKPHPRATDHFVITEAVRAAIWGPPEAPQLQLARETWCRCELGEGPKALPVMLPGDDPAAIFPQFYKMYKAAGLWCSGNAETAKRWNAEGRLEERACPCEYLESGECGAEATLNLVLPDVPGLGVWQITMGNYAAIVRLNTGLEQYSAAFGGLRGIPFTLRLEPEETQRWDDQSKTMKRTTIYSVRLDTDLTMRQIVEHRSRAGVALKATAVGMLMPHDAGGNGESEPTVKGEAEPPWEISMAYRAAGQLGLNPAQYARYFEYKYGRQTGDCSDADVVEEHAMFRGLEADPERARRWVSQAAALTDAQLEKRRREARQGQMKLGDGQ